MWFAVLTLLLWTGASYSSSRTARIAGSLRGNRWRLLIAAGPLALAGPLAAGGAVIPAWYWFAAGGILHLGLGDVALYAAYRRLGPRLGLLVCLCLVPPLAGIIEWLWLGTRPGWPETILGVLIVGAVAVALAPAERLRLPRELWWPGIIAAVLAACGQALGAVVTRQGFAVNPDAGAMESAFWRVATGALVLVIIGWLCRRPPALDQNSRRRATTWVLWSVALGPCLGIPAYHMALSQAPAALVQAVLAALPLTVIPLAWYFDGDRPSARSLLGGTVAVLATMAMMLVYAGR